MIPWLEAQILRAKTAIREELSTSPVDPQTILEHTQRIEAWQRTIEFYAQQLSEKGLDDKLYPKTSRRTDAAPTQFPNIRYDLDFQGQLPDDLLSLHDELKEAPLGRIVRGLRNEAHLTGQEVASKVGKSYSYFSLLETGKRVFSERLMRSTLDALLPRAIEGESNSLRIYLEMRACWEYGDTFLEKDNLRRARSRQVPNK